MTTLDIARHYVSQGFNVIPWKHKAKSGGQPKMWQYYQHNRVTDEELVKWFSSDNVGIAIITGKISGITVVDDDIKDGSRRFLSSLVAMSGGGGLHYYYQYDPSIPTIANPDIHVDIRNDGGLIFAYPLIHPSGTMYQWENGLESVTRENLIKIPQNPLISQCLQYKQYIDTEKQKKLTAEGYGLFFNRSTGSRDTSLKEFCTELWKKGMSREQIFSLANLVNKSYDPPLSEDVVRQKVESTFKGLGDHLNTHAPLTSGVGKQKEEEKPLPFTTYTGLQIFQAYEDLMQQYGNGISTGWSALDEFTRLYPQHLYMVTAGTHIGKTTFATAIGVNAACTGHRVLYFSLEDGLFIRDKIASISGISDIPFTVVDCDRFPKPSEILQYIEEMTIKPEVMIIDHIHFLQAEERMETIKEKIASVASDMKIVSKNLKIPVICLVHIRKQDRIRDESPVIDDMKDAQELGGLANVVYILHRKRKKIEEMDEDNTEYFEPQGTITIAKAKLPKGKTGLVNFTITGNSITVERWIKPIKNEAEIGRNARKGVKLIHEDIN